MRYRFDAFLLDTGQFELRRGDAIVPVEPLIFDLLKLFVQSPGAVIDRDRMSEIVWQGRIVSDATISTAIRSARRALDDSGADQSRIETVRGRGFRFRPAVTVEQTAAATPHAPEAPAPPDAEHRTGGRPSVAVLPFTRLGAPEPHAGLEDAIPHEVILALSRLRWLFVIARGSCFQFRGPDVDTARAGHLLGARYCLTGTLETYGRTLAIGVELCDTTTGAAIWGDHYTATLDDAQALRAEIARGIVGALETQIQLNEALIAQSRPAENLDAWQAFHLGLKHVHHYTRTGNAAAQALFLRATELEPGFARAHAGLSYAHFQNAFMRYLPDRPAEVAAAFRAAERGLELDPLDPFANFNMGRGFWLRKDLDHALPWLERATIISPNYAQGIYSRAMTDLLAGRPDLGFHSVDLAMELSPLDPLLYAMRGVKALARVAQGDFTQAAFWADAAVRTPGAHVIIEMIALVCHTLAGDDAMARHWARQVRRHKPGATQDYFFEALPIRDPAARAHIARAFAAHGF